MINLGIDNISLARPLLAGARVGLMTNPTGVNSDMRSTIDVINETYNLSALFACEHGVRGCAPAGDKIDTFKDERTGVTVYSCYGSNTHLTPEMLDKFDVFVFDIQDAGARFYTYIYSLADAMVSCAKANKPVIVLDRPAPLDGKTVQGTLLDERFSSFVGRFSLPTRYALTVGEFALWTKAHLKLDLDLSIIPMTGWKREFKYADTGLKFVPPSPNLSCLHTADIYTGTCIFEGTNISEGRGTCLPFEYIGAPFMDAYTLSKRMNEVCPDGFFFREAYFTPSCSKHAGCVCSGVQIYITDPEHANPVLCGLKLLEEMLKLYPTQIEWLGKDENGVYTIDRLLGTDEFRLGKLSASALIEKHLPLISAWQKDSAQFYLY